MTNHKSHHIFIYLGLLVGLFILVFGINYFQSHYTFQKIEPVIATQDYDEGALTERSFVPKKVEEVDSFVVKKQEAKSISLLPENYISGHTNWPPVVEEINEMYFCNIGTEEGERPVIVTEEIIGGRTFCIEKGGGGSTGSFYSSQIYKTKNLNGIKQTDFTLRFNKCDFFEDPERSECKYIQSTFDINTIINSLDW